MKKEDRKFTILLDMDDTITDYLPYCVEVYNKIYKQENKVEEIVEWEIPSSFKYGLFSIHSTDFLQDVPQRSNSIKYINKWLREGHNVVIVSDCNNNGKDYENKIKWLKKNIPNFNVKNFIPCSEKYLIKGDIFVDDNVGNLNKWLDNNPYGVTLLMEAQHNLTLEDERRITDFSEIDETIQVINMLRTLNSIVQKKGN